MSRPIDIPRSRNRGSANILARNALFPADEGPYFGFIELHPSQAQWAVSNHDHGYIEVSPFRQLPPLAFIVVKDRGRRTITIEFTNFPLKKAIDRAILSHDPSHPSLHVDFATCLQYYDALRLQLDQLQASNPNDHTAAGLALLVGEVLVDHTIYEGIGLSKFQRRRALHHDVGTRIHQHRLTSGLDEVRECFSAGLIPEDLGASHLWSLNAQCRQLARDGEYEELQRVCEPLIRAGEIEVAYDAGLLMTLLESSHLEAFVYILDLIDRTRDLAVDFEDLDEPNVTYDTFCVAIRLGHRDTALHFATRDIYFEGRVHAVGDGSEEDAKLLAGGGYVLDPLSAAVFWNKPSIVQVLLDAGPTYSAGFPRALELARALPGRPGVDILELLLNHQSIARQQSFSHSAVAFPETHAPQQWGLPSPLPEIHEQGPFDLNDAMNSVVPKLLVHSWVDLFTEAEPVSETPSFLPQGSSRLDPTRPPRLAPVSTPGLQRTNRQCPGWISQTLPFVRRRSVGHGLVQRLNRRRQRVQDFCARHCENSSYWNLSGHFNSLEVICDSGLTLFRRLIFGAVPNSLVEIIHTLLVAEACIAGESEVSRRLQQHFLHDFQRWGQILQTAEQKIFHEIVQDVWGGYIGDTANDGKDRLLNVTKHFVAPDEPPSCRVARHEHPGLTLRRLRKPPHLTRHANKDDGPQATSLSLGQNDSIDDLLSRLTRDTDSSDNDEDFDLGEFIHLHALEEESDCNDIIVPAEIACHAPGQELSETTVSLIGSVSFSAILAFVSTGNSSHEAILQLLQQRSPNYHRSALILESFFQLTDSREEETSEHARQGAEYHLSRMKSAMREKATARSFVSPPSASSTSFKSPLRSSLGSPSASSLFSSDFSSTDVESATTRADSTRRYGCPSRDCPKTFTTVSNRNKHARDSCSFRKRRGYACRNDGCTKILTTKWYRNTHEIERCPFRERLLSSLGEMVQES